MQMERIQIENWRSIKSIVVDANSLMVIIGQNNHGKSNLLSAVLFFFGEIRHQALDFNHEATELFVQVTFTDLDENDRGTFKKYLTSDNKIVVRKTAHLDGSFEYRGFLEQPTEKWLREATASAYTKRELAENLAFHPFLPSSGRLSKQNIIDAQLAYIEANRDSLNFAFEAEETNFMGLKNVAKGIFGEVFFIPAVKEASDDFSTKESSGFGKLYSDIISSMSEQDEDWKETRTRLENLFLALNKVDENGDDNRNRPTQLAEFEAELSEELQTWGATVDIEVAAPNIEDVFRANTLVWVNDGVRTDIRRKGHGLQRALTVALIRVIANRSLNGQGGETSETTSRKTSRSRYFIFEEPELYLHPQAQRALFDSFVDLSEHGNQVLLCTHSAALIDVERYQSIYIVTKDDEAVGTTIRRCGEELFDGDAKKNFNLSYWINPDRSELFFAAKVVLVEGQTDATVIPLLAKTLSVYRYDYTVIDCGSKDNLPLYIRLLNKFLIPYVVIYDRDHQSGKSPEAIATADNSSQRIENEIDTSLGSSIVFENDIEEEIGVSSSSSNKPYVAIQHITSTDYEIPEQVADKIKEAYAGIT